MTAQDVYNIRIKIKRLLPLMNENTDYQSFQDVMNNPKFGAKDLNADNKNVSSDEACNATTTIWSEVMNNHNKSKSDTLVCFSEYMELLKMKDKVFSYEILAYSAGDVTGCFWMTSTMRKNFELFGSFLSVDVMKRDTNKLLWPYMAVTMYNEMDSVCVGCEGMVLSEREEAYRQC